MLIVYCGLGGFLIAALALCAFLRRSAVESEQLSGPLVEDLMVSAESMIHI
jgi:hypothetical protein